MSFGGGEKRRAYFEVPAQTLLGEMSCWDDIPRKKGKHELESLGACYRSLALIQMGVSRGVKNKTKPLFSRNEAWHGQHNVVVMAGQTADY